MPICMGVLCERCRTVYFICASRRSPRIHYDRVRGEYKIICASPCNAAAPFYRSMLKPYSVSDEVLAHGCAHISNCQPIGEVRANSANHTQGVP
jgi:hypothetical protein